VGAAVAGGGELTGTIEIQRAGQAVLPDDMIEHLEAAVERFLGRKRAVERLSGGIVGSENEGRLGQVRSKPPVRTTVDEDQLAETCPAFSTSPVVALRTVSALGWNIGITEPAPESFRVELDSVLLFQGFSEMAVVVLCEQGPT